MPVFCSAFLGVFSQNCVADYPAGLGGYFEHSVSAKNMASSYEISVKQNEALIKNALLTEDGHKKIISKMQIDTKKLSDIAALDHLIRLAVYEYILGHTKLSDETKLVSRLKSVLLNLFHLCSRKRFPPAETFQINVLIFDMVTLNVAEQLFSILDTWQEYFKNNRKEFSKQVQQCTLRLCNDLLRRLSTTGSRDIKFSGKVQLYLAQLFPIDEKSGLNLPSNFNYENITNFTEEEDTSLPLDEAALAKAEIAAKAAAAKELAEAADEGEEMETDDKEAGEITAEVEAAKAEKEDDSDKSKVTYKIYKAIWGLQKYFNNPCIGDCFFKQNPCRNSA